MKIELQSGLGVSDPCTLALLDSLPNTGCVVENVTVGNKMVYIDVRLSRDESPDPIRAIFDRGRLYLLGGHVSPDAPVKDLRQKIVIPLRHFDCPPDGPTIAIPICGLNVPRTFADTHTFLLADYTTQLGQIPQGRTHYTVMANIVSVIGHVFHCLAGPSAKPKNT